MIDAQFVGLWCFVSQRRDIVTGSVEPTDDECEWQSDRDEEEELAVSSY